MSKPFKTTICEGIAELVFDHPPVNAFDSKGWAAIAAEIEALGGNDDVNVIIIAAEGRGFCAGVDIKELAADRNLIVAVNKGNYDTFKAVHLNPKPVIVAVHGFVLGGGLGASYVEGRYASTQAPAIAKPFGGDTINDLNDLFSDNTFSDNT